MRVGGRPRVMLPQLITGCKLWHLRASGSFYPKAAWQRALAALPPGAQARCQTRLLRHPRDF